MSAFEFNVITTTRSYGEGPRFKVSYEGPGKRGIDLSIPGIVEREECRTAV